MSPHTHVNQIPSGGHLWTTDDVSAYLRCSKRHVTNLCKAGLPHVYLGRLQRFRKEDVEHFLAGNPRLAIRRERRVKRACVATLKGKDSSL